MLNGAAIEFERSQDVPDGGVLLALPALLVLGLLSNSRENFSMSEGFYPLESIFLVLSLMALGRISSLEALRYEAPGEWGKLLGLDGFPEVRTLRQKITELCAEQGRVQHWSSALAKQWMAQEPESAGVFYADGHVRVYHGKLTNLPRRYVARERLCLRGPPITGSMRWMDGPFSWSAARSIRVYSMCCASRLCRDSAPMCPTNPRQSSSKPSRS